jgi:hypothetical protein
MKLFKEVKVEALILAQDLVGEVKGRLGIRHPAARLLGISLEFRKEALPDGVRHTVPDDWIWHEGYPYWLLSCLSRAGELKPACWLRSDVLHLLDIATSHVFGLPPEQMRWRLSEIRRSWQEALPSLEEEGAVRLEEPPGLGNGWLGLFEWRSPDACEEELMGPGPVLTFRWTPLYRYEDVAKVVSILARDSLSCSPFGDSLTRDIRRVAAALRRKYGLRASRSPRRLRESKQTELKQARIALLRHLKEDEKMSLREIDYWFCLRPTLATSLQARAKVFRDRAPSELDLSIVLAKDLKATRTVAELVTKWLRRFSARKIDKGVFQVSSRTRLRDWKALQG